MVQPDWILNYEFEDLAMLKYNPPRLKERIFRLFCARGKLLNGQDGKISKQPKCVMLHHNNLYLKIGPFNTEIVSYYPYRAMFHNVSFIFYQITSQMLFLTKV